MHFSSSYKVLFRHCDPAGIVFYPRYFEMLNDTVEAMFSELLGWPFEEMHPAGGVPTAAMNIVFRAPSRLGDHIDLKLTIKGLGGASMGLHTVAAARDEERFAADHTIVCVNGRGRRQRWPEDVRTRVNGILDASA